MNHKNLSILFLSFVIAVVTSNAQINYGYILPSYEERFGKGIRKVVMIQDDIKRTTKVARNGSFVKPFRTHLKPTFAVQKQDSSITRRNRETMTDSIFWMVWGHSGLL